jgi:hypothetical protein
VNRLKGRQKDNRVKTAIETLLSSQLLTVLLTHCAEFDFPFALLYSVAEDSEIDECSSMSSESSMAMKSCVLEGTLGVPEGHPAAPTKLDLKRARGGFIPAFRDAMQTREPKMLNILDGTLSESLIEGLEWRGFGQPCKLAVGKRYSLTKLLYLNMNGSLGTVSEVVKSLCCSDGS